MSIPSIRCISNDSEFAGLKEQWNSLLRKSASDNIFLTWEWVYSWWMNFKKNKDLYLIIAEENGCVIGIAPLYVSSSRTFGLRSRKYIEFLGTTGVCAEYLDFILLKGREKELINAIMEFIYNDRSTHWNGLNLVSIREDSKNLGLIREYLKETNRECSEYESIRSPYIQLPVTFEEYSKVIGRRSRNKIKSYRNKLDALRETGPVTLKVVDNSDILDESFNILTQLHQKRWTGKGVNGSFASERPHFLSFHRDIIRQFFEAKWLSLIMLKVNDIPVAGHYNFEYANKTYCYSVGFDPAWADYKVGNILLLLVVEDAIKRKKSEFDFLRGTEDYKFIWTEKTRTSVSIISWRKSGEAIVVNIENILRKIAKLFIPDKLAIRIYKRIMIRDDD